MLKGIVDGVQGWGKYVNANGGIGGRKVQVDFIDSKLNPNETRNAIDQGVLVTTSHSSARPRCCSTTPTTSPTARTGSGKATGIPDVAALITNAAEGCAATGYAITPPSVKCDTIDQSPQTYRANNGDSKYLLKQNNKDLHGSFVLAGRLAVGGEDVAGALQGRGGRGHQESTRTWQSPATRRRASTRRSSSR